MQRAAFGHACDRPAAGPDLEDVDHRNLDRKRLLIAADQRGTCGQHMGIEDHAGLGGGAAMSNAIALAIVRLAAGRPAWR